MRGRCERLVLLISQTDSGVWNMDVATSFTRFPDAGVVVRIGAATVATAMVRAAGAPIEISIGAAPPAGSRGMIVFQDLPPLTLFGGAAGSWTSMR